MEPEARLTAKDQHSKPNCPLRRSRRHTKPSSSNPSTCSTYQTRSSSRHQSNITTHTQATTAYSHRPQQGSSAGRRHRNVTAARRTDAARPGRKTTDHLAVTPAREVPRKEEAPAYVPAVPEEEIPSYIDFVNDPAHEFWTWSQQEEGWYHEDKEDGTIIWAPTELD